MSDSVSRLYRAVVAAKDMDPASSRTARLFQRGPERIAKKMAEEAIEVVIDAVNLRPDAVVRESADLIYNLTVLWVASGITPQQVWEEMDRREREQGIAEKIPKPPKPPKGPKPLHHNPVVTGPSEIADLLATNDDAKIEAGHDVAVLADLRTKS